MRILVAAGGLMLAACAPSPAGDPARTHICTAYPNGLTECHLVEDAT